MGKVSVSYRTGGGDSFRSWFAWALRRAADKLDGFSSIGIHVNTTPELTDDQVTDAWERGLHHFADQLAMEVDHEVTEKVMRSAVPWTNL